MEQIFNFMVESCMSFDEILPHIISGLFDPTVAPTSHVRPSATMVLLIVGS
jgi:hypothetical protein